MSYTYRVRSAIGAPKVPWTSGRGPWRAIVGHWTVGNPGYAGWRSTVTAVLAGSDRPGGRNVSYHEGWCWDEATRTFTAERIVPVTAASHSMNATPPPAGPWEPDAVCRSLLGDGARDPNRWTYACAIAGMPAHVARWVRDPDFVEACARRARELQNEFPTLPDRPIFEHFRGQNNKSDWGRELTPLIYARLGGTQPAPPPAPIPDQEENVRNETWALAPSTQEIAVNEGAELYNNSALAADAANVEDVRPGRYLDYYGRRPTDKGTALLVGIRIPDTSSYRPWWVLENDTTGNPRIKAAAEPADCSAVEAELVSTRKRLDNATGRIQQAVTALGGTL